MVIPNIWYLSLYDWTGVCVCVAVCVCVGMWEYDMTSQFGATLGLDGQ